MLCSGCTLTDFPISIRLTSLALWQSNDCPSASKATLMNMDKYVMWIHYERLHNHNKAKHNKTVCIFLGIYCITVITCTHNNRKGNTSVKVRTHEIHHISGPHGRAIAYRSWVFSRKFTMIYRWCIVYASNPLVSLMRCSFTKLQSMYGYIPRGNN